jgi:hypothetical protein
MFLPKTVLLKDDECRLARDALEHVLRRLGLFETSARGAGTETVRAAAASGVEVLALGRMSIGWPEPQPID